MSFDALTSFVFGPEAHSRPLLSSLSTFPPAKLPVSTNVKGSPRGILSSLHFAVHLSQCGPQLRGRGPSRSAAASTCSELVSVSECTQADRPSRQGETLRRRGTRTHERIACCTDAAQRRPLKKRRRIKQCSHYALLEEGGGGRQCSGNEMIPVDSLSRDIFLFRQPFSAAKFNLLLSFFWVGRTGGLWACY